MQESEASLMTSLTAAETSDNCGLWARRLIIGVQTKGHGTEGHRTKGHRQKATERNVKMLLSCQDVLERLRVVLKTVEQIVLSSVLVCRPSLFLVYLSSVLVNCSTTATVCRPIGPSLSVLTANN